MSDLGSILGALFVRDTIRDLKSQQAAGKAADEGYAATMAWVADQRASIRADLDGSNARVTAAADRLLPGWAEVAEDYFEPPVRSGSEETLWASLATADSANGSIEAWFAMEGWGDPDDAENVRLFENAQAASRRLRERFGEGVYDGFLDIVRGGMGWQARMESLGWWAEERGIESPFAQGVDVADGLERLTALHREGALTDEEFTLAKQQLLAG